MTNIFFQTHGCPTNFSESEIMQALLAKVGFKSTNKESADIIIINICTVKGETTALKEIRKAKEEFPNKKLIATGCITPEIIPKIREISEDISLVSTHNITKITTIVEETLHNNVVEMLAKDDKEIKLCLPKIRKNPVIGIIPILSGCNSYCSYCSVKLIKGKLFSYPSKKIIEEVKSCLKDCKEIWITSQDNAAYMLEKKIKSDLPLLLNDILRINKNFKIRIGMMNPVNVMPITHELIEIYKNNKIFKFLHLPVQSGNNDILRLMNRHYKVEDFKQIVAQFRKNISNITISTDIIVGFPTETEEQFQDSLNLIKEVKPDIVNISKFTVRPNTKAAEMEQLEGSIIKKRSRLLTHIHNNIARMQNERWLEWQGTILIDEKGKNNSWIGRNFAYKPVIVKDNFGLGQEIKVRIDSVTSFDLRGNVV